MGNRCGDFKDINGSMMSVHVNAPSSSLTANASNGHHWLTHETMAGRYHTTSTKDSFHPTLNRNSLIARSSRLRARSEFPRCKSAINPSRHRL